MKNDLLRRMEAKHKARYEALFRQKMRMVLQLAQDAAMIAANEVLQMGTGRAEDFNRTFVEAVSDIGVMMFEDQKDDKEFVYTKEKVDRRLKEICGENFQPWEVRYGEERAP